VVYICCSDIVTVYTISLRGVDLATAAGVQIDLWSFFKNRETNRVDGENHIGPYKVFDEYVYRNMNCSAYDLCLGFAARRRWESFVCVGCYRTQGGSFYSQEELRNMRLKRLP